MTDEPSKEVVYRLTVAVRCIDSRDIIVQHLSNFGFLESISTDSENDDRLYLDIDSTSDLYAIWRKVRRLSRGKPRFEILSHSIKVFFKSNWGGSRYQNSSVVRIHHP